MKTYKTKDMHCPKCNYLFNACSNLDGSDGRPVEGDHSLCIGCGALLRFNKDLILEEETNLEELTKEQLKLFEQLRNLIKQTKRR